MIICMGSGWNEDDHIQWAQEIESTAQGDWKNEILRVSHMGVTADEDLMRRVLGAMG